MVARIDGPSGSDPSRLADSGPGLGPFVAISVVYLLAILVGSWFLGHFEQVEALAPDQWGDVLAGIFSPLAFLWLVYASLSQRTELSLQRHELQTVYQPKFKLDGGELVGFEALVRWQHPVHGTVAPSLFVPLVEETGMVMALGEHVLRQTCMEAAHWPAPLSLAVNVSAKQLEAGNLHLLVQRCLTDSGLPPERLELELTESAFLHHSDRVLEQLMHLRRMGVRLALDDFGTGFSSLAYLQQLPLTNLKIDRSFVIALSAEKPDRKAVAIVQAVIALAQGIGATTTAEGLDTPQQIERLRAMGCELGQGYGLCRPIPAGQARSLMAGGPFATVAMSNPGAVINRLALDTPEAP